MVRDLRDRGDRRQVPEVSVKTPRTSLRAGQRTVGDEMVAPERTKNATPGWRERVNGLAGSGKGAATAVKSLNGRQIRGIALLSALALTVFTALLAPFGLSPWWLPILGLVATGGIVAWLRQSAMKERAARSTSRSVQATPRSATRSSQPATRGAAPQRAKVQSKTHAPARRPAPATASVETSAAPVVEQAPVSSPAPFGFEAPAATAEQPVEQPVEQVLAQQPAAQAEPFDAAGSWAPIAVPPPTYTLKQRAPQTNVEPAGTVADQLQQIDELPFDGLALDEDLEELPSVYRAG
ncbi:hypothetical protein GCM10027579_27960 [Calidifontibacter terrae]